MQQMPTEQIINGMHEKQFLQRMQKMRRMNRMERTQRTQRLQIGKSRKK